MRIIILFCLIGYCYGGVSWGQSIQPSDSTEQIRSKLYKKLTAPQEYETLKHSFEGVVGRVTDSESIWVHIEDRRDFIFWTRKLSKNNLNLDRQEVRVWLRYVSPKRSISKGKAYNTQFKEWVRASIESEFLNRRVRVSYHLLPKPVYRMKGMVWAKGTSINFLMVQKGYSFYLIEKGNSKYHNDFVNAEKFARENKQGLWQLN